MLSQPDTLTGEKLQKHVHPSLKIKRRPAVHVVRADQEQRGAPEEVDVVLEEAGHGVALPCDFV